MEEIIAPISKEILKAELSEDKRLRFTNKSHNEIYVITHQDSPNVMKEIGRLREIAFRAAGGGTGKAMDIDEYDAVTDHLVVVDESLPRGPEQIVGTYRLLRREVADKFGKFYTSGEYDITPLLSSGAVLLELGRSCVRADMRGRNRMKSP